MYGFHSRVTGIQLDQHRFRSAVDRLDRPILVVDHPSAIRAHREWQGLEFRPRGAQPLLEQWEDGARFLCLGAAVRVEVDRGRAGRPLVPFGVERNIDYRVWPGDRAYEKRLQRFGAAG
ncbi:hypothetical protein TPR58_17855 [Sphingomonas sp. HF-S3]|uniref:RES domain-containing protein n=1 Tax=Sphingomonas rustica TaxID=3103142 RepID=A0ABV0BBV3_9SPHN